MLTACVIFAVLVAIPSGNTLVPRELELITFGTAQSLNDIIGDQFDIPIPKAVNTMRKGITATGDECFCVIDNPSLYLPPVINRDCICKKNCCPERKREYLPPVDCEICPKCICDITTYKLINEDSGHCPVCRRPPPTTPPPPKKCVCHNGIYVNEAAGNCPVPCHPPPCQCVNGKYINEKSGNCPGICLPPPCYCSYGRMYNENSGNCPAVCEPPPCVCTNGRYVNEKSGNCPAICVPPPCTCQNGRLINEKSGNCPPCKPPCTCYKGKLINEDVGVCPKSCPYYFEKPVGYENLSADFL